MERKRWSGDNSNTSMPPNWRSPDCAVKFKIRLSSRTQAPPLPKLMSLNLLKVFCSFAASRSGGARNSPRATSTPMRRIPAMSTVPAMRATEMPVARMTVTSLPRASEPRPSSEPMRAAIGSSSNACCGMFRTVNHTALSRV